MFIETAHDPDRDLTILVVSGPVTLDEMITTLDDFYAKGATRLTLWDMSQSDLSTVTPDDILRFIQKAAELGVERNDGRTAVFVKDDLQYGLGRMAETFATFENLGYSLSLFRAREDALAWLLLE